ncbi:dTDP-4-dehydrorhamnose 3,5-epimerase [Emticicia sp. CRIBPO]|uniref:dTDP-4-dehydrorhamnose 3,5-epimerase n=1 Tax=Emticicia sp. CRIBPO TaxID=2683258 RepID=UPI00141357BF|nr:dTDP-4-dehydrorhamnose 3,5-epimerase [Emticicia sp. CRIBPO]NBA88270.1 dTDP-4-dehydrorhamnose 3,5-epimerase [Emticicia sp. CRIBPO]
MEFKKSAILGLTEIFPRIFKDERGHFLETYQYELFKNNGVAAQFIQDNQSFSTKGVLRGLHFQNAPHAQGKLVRVISGKVLDVAVDIRPDSPTFGQHETFVLTAELSNMVFIPEGFAHGFLTLEDAVFSYKCTNLYNKASEGGLLWNDPEIGINWGYENPLVSEKDVILPTLAEFKKSL